MDWTADVIAEAKANGAVEMRCKVIDNLAKYRIGYPIDAAQSALTAFRSLRYADAPAEVEAWFVNGNGDYIIGADGMPIQIFL